jgi:hypothetical protein
MLVLPDNMIGRPIGFTCSTFDLLHAGHILMLAECKTICDMFNYLPSSLLMRLLFMIQKKTLKTC